MKRIVAGIVVCLICGFMYSAGAEESSVSNAFAREVYLNDLIRSHDYLPGKNSFIIQHLRKGDKTTLLELDGPGSVRHFWTTWSVGAGEDFANMAGQVILRVYLNGESQPAIEGSIYEMCHAAEQSQSPLAAMPTFNFNRSLNLFTPIFFEKGIRIEAEAAINLGELFIQVDYRQTKQPESSLRLVSRKTSDGIILEYVDSKTKKTMTTNDWQKNTSKPVLTKQELEIPLGEKGITITGPAIIRSLTFHGEQLDDLELLIFWDGDSKPAVKAPLRYFFGGFNNVAINSETDSLTTWFPMPFARSARLVLQGADERKVPVVLEKETLRSLPEDVFYFHALFQEENPTLGYVAYEALRTTGRGHFVGVNYFDTGGNHGGGDTALIDPGTQSPRVVHGINGEDYFAFAWHDTGLMNLLTGAPVHERRYRLHLENPYPFTESLLVTFGVFAENHTKSVVFWYQSPKEAAESDWAPINAPWNVLGPLQTGTPLPNEPDDLAYTTEVRAHLPIPLEVTWQTADMKDGFLDLTDHFRHFAMKLDGTGFLIGDSVMKLVAYVHSEKSQNVQVRWGHDDAMNVELNGKSISHFPAGQGLYSSQGTLPLEAGWNELSITLENQTNVNWRWNGFFWAIKQPITPLTFSKQKP